MDLNLHSIATIRSCYKEKFGTPRQPGLISSSEAVIEFNEPYNNSDYFRELESFSHLWIIFIFHLHIGKPVKATVRPPRLGGNKRLGVFASRSPFRPNPVGLSVVKIEDIKTDSHGIKIYVSGIDIIDETPVIDIKPYIPYTDSIPAAEAAYANHAPEFKLTVDYSESALKSLAEIEKDHEHFRQLITETIALDPRPAYSDDEGEYGVSLYDYNIRWTVNHMQALVTSIE